MLRPLIIITSLAFYLCLAVLPFVVASAARFIAFLVDEHILIECSIKHMQVVVLLCASLANSMATAYTKPCSVSVL
jgi:hypothetical protein